MCEWQYLFVVHTEVLGSYVLWKWIIESVIQISLHLEYCIIDREEPTKLLSNHYKYYKTKFWNKWLYLWKIKCVQTMIFIEILFILPQFAKVFLMYKYNGKIVFFFLRGKIDTAFFLGRPVNRPKFRKDYRLGYGFVVMIMSQSRS